MPYYCLACPKSRMSPVRDRQGRGSIKLAGDELLVAFGHAAGRGVAGVDEDARRAPSEASWERSPRALSRSCRTGSWWEIPTCLVSHSCYHTGKGRKTP